MARDWPEYKEADARCWKLAHERFGSPLPRDTADRAGKPCERSRRPPPRDPDGNVNCFVVILKALVAPSGEVVEVWPVRRNGDAERCAGHERTAIKSVREWKLEPTLLKGKPVPVCMDVAVNLTPR